MAKGPSEISFKKWNRTISWYWAQIHVYTFFPPIPYGISGNSVQGFTRSCAYKKNDRPETYMYHVQKVCGKITLTLNFKKPINENMGFR